MHNWMLIREHDTKKWKPYQDSLANLLTIAIDACGASKGNVQLLNRHRKILQIVAHCGFGEEFLSQLECVRTDANTVCSRAFRLGRRIVVPDVNEDPAFAPYLAIAVANGFRAVQSTPILTSDGEVIGVYSTHFPQTTHLTPDVEEILDDCSIQMARHCTGLIFN